MFNKWDKHFTEQVWDKHFTEQVLNKGKEYYVDSDLTVLEELFFMLRWEIESEDEGGGDIEDVAKSHAYISVIEDFLVPGHQEFFKQIVKDMYKEKGEKDA